MGSTYAHIHFNSEIEESLHRVIVLYRKTPDNPSGERGVELAFKILDQDGRLIAWLVFQMDQEKLKEVYGQSVEDMKLYHFRPKKG